MTDTTDILEIAEQNHRNLEALAAELDAEDRLDDTVAPRGDMTADDRAKYLGLDAGESAMQAALDDDERAARLLVQNAENLQRLLDAAGVDSDEIAGEESGHDKAVKFLSEAHGLQR